MQVCPVSELSALLANAPTKEPQAKHPKGWTPGFEQQGENGTCVTRPYLADEDPKDRDLISSFDLDPDEWQVAGDINVRKWQRYDGEWLKYFKFNVTRRLLRDRVDVAELLKIAERKKPRSTGTVTTSNPTFVVSLNDWQIGKSCEVGGGSVETVERVLDSMQRVRLRLKELTKVGRRPSRVILANTGDLVEQVSGHYASQLFIVDLNLREQLRVARRLLFRFMDELVSDGYPVTMTAVGCNHGSVRNGAGKTQTTNDDNLSLVLVESIEEACAANPGRYAEVDFLYAPDGLVLVMDVDGVNLGLTHGHQIPGGGQIQGTASAAKWWQGQIMGCQPIASADILMTAHRHYLEVSENTGRTVIQAPALDGGSNWFTTATGKNSPPGMLTLTVGKSHDRGWGDLHLC